MRYTQSSVNGVGSEVHMGRSIHRVKSEVYRVGYTVWNRHGVGSEVYRDRSIHGLEYTWGGVYTEWDTHGVWSEVYTKE